MNKRSPRKWLAEARLAAGFTQQRLVNVLECSLTALQKWEAGTSDPMPCHARELDRLLVAGSGVIKARLDAEREESQRDRARARVSA